MDRAAARNSITERFNLIRTIGEGATGRVFEVEDVVLGGRLALKQFRRDRFTSPEHLARFKDEFRGFQRITHPNLVKVYELISEGEDTYLLMELVLGDNFIEHVGLHPDRGSEDSGEITRPMSPVASRRTQRPPLGLLGTASIAKLRAALPQLVAGIAALHAQGKVHCDIKPSNVLVTPEDRVVILDFGCATESTHEEGFVRGTLPYMAPEQYEGVYTESVDWYAVGALLYQALTGRRPFPGRSSGHAYSKGPVHLEDPRRLVPGLPDDLSELALSLLEQYPDRRPNVDEIARVVGAELPPRSAPPPVLGRDLELQRLASLFAEARRDGCRVVHIQGESGIGKTALVSQFARALDPGCAVLVGTCYVDASVPYKGLDSVVDRLATLLDRLDIPLDDTTREGISQTFPVFAREDRPVPEQDPALLRIRAVEAFRQVLQQLAERGPVVLIIDDFHWSDAESIELLADVLHPPLPKSLLIVLSYRGLEDGTDERVRHIQRRLPRHALITVGPLGPDVIGMMAARTIELDATALDSIVRESQGNPLFATELVRAHIADSSGPLTFQEVLASRISHLDPAQRAYLEVVSLAGRPVEDEVAVRAVNASRAGSLEVRRSLLAASLIRDSQARERAVEPYHDRIREHVVGDLTPDAARVRHAALAEAYEAVGTPDPETLLIHHRGAGNITKARSYAEHAGDVAASALAFDHAATLYRAAIEMFAGQASRDLLIKHAKALSNGGQPAEAAKAFLGALENDAGNVELRLAAGDELLRAGDVEQGLSHLREVAATLGESIPKNKTVLRLRLLWNALKLRFLRLPPLEELTPKEDGRLELCNSLGFRLTLEDYELGTLFRFRYLYLALRAGVRLHVANGLSFVAGMPSLMPGWMAGGVHRSRQLIAAGQQLLREDDPVLTRGMFLYAASMVDFSKGRWRAHRRVLEQIVELGHGKHAIGLHWSAAFVEGVITALLWIEGDVPELRRRLPGYMLAARGYRAIESMHALVGGTTLSLCDDRPAEARHLAAGAIEAWSSDSWRIQHHLEAVARAEIDLYEDKPLDAWGCLRHLWERSKTAGFFRIPFYRFTALFLRARVNLAGGLLSEAARDIRHLRSRPDGWVAAAGEAFYACLLVQQGQRETAVASLERASRQLSEWDLHLYALAAKSRLAELTDNAAGVAEARRALLAHGIRNPDQLVRSFLPVRSVKQESRALSTPNKRWSISTAKP